MSKYYVFGIVLAGTFSLISVSILYSLYVFRTVEFVDAFRTLLKVACLSGILFLVVLVILIGVVLFH